MVFKALQDKFKVKSGKKALKQKLNRLERPHRSNKGIVSLGCIVDMDNFSDTDAFNQMRKEFALKPNAIQIIGYKRDFDKISPFGVQFFTDQHLGWKGTIENMYAKDFMSRDFDVLINYFTTDNIMPKLVSASTKARLRVGFSDIDERFNDLILESSLNDFSTFKNELKKYLRVLGEIT